MPAYVVVHLAKGRTTAARVSRALLTSGRLKRVIEEHQGLLLPESEGDAGNVETAGVATITVPDMTRANKLAAALRGIDDIETAYAKPGEELP